MKILNFGSVRYINLCLKKICQTLINLISNFSLDFAMQSFPVDVTAPGSFLHDAFHQAHPTRNPKDGVFLQFAELTEEPRIIKTHLPFSLLSPSLPKTCKVRLLLYISAF